MRNSKRIQKGKDLFSDSHSPAQKTRRENGQLLPAYGGQSPTVSLQRGLFCLENADSP
ncbi:hypothetical protein RB3545 [Rhodopirellula baltica SH 1]|uniref:Uncharacterized protein n=1 Tax=Rhodopirellula baltica (strain DSM 10527 / NCIMB 13988 / SH1) TaxID=243090 RepID=Q7UU33_RHOBA|nr:hypothetical protein RB3545 [Rhodopirellula baltica SH 1]